MRNDRVLHIDFDEVPLYIFIKFQHVCRDAWGGRRGSGGLGSQSVVLLALFCIVNEESFEVNI